MGYISSGQSCSRSPFHTIGNVMRETFDFADCKSAKQNKTATTTRNCTYVKVDAEYADASKLRSQLLACVTRRAS